MKMIFHSALLALTISIVTSCASRTEGWFSSGASKKLSAKEHSSIKSQALKHWAKRIDAVELKKSLEKFEILASSTDKNLDYLVYLTRGFYLLADAHYTDMDQKKKTWEIGTSWGEKAMAKDAAFEKQMKAGENVEDHLGLLSKKYVGAIYWTAANLGKWAKNSGIATTLKYKNRIRRLVKRLQDLSPKYFYYAANRYWGGYYAVAPGFAGGDMNKSEKNFKASIANAPEYLGTRVLYAKLYAVKKGNQKLFKEQLNIVLKSKRGSQKIAPENYLEQQKAKKLLAEMDDLF